MAMSYEETKAQNNKANLADAQRKGLADASGNYKQDELGRTYNTDTAKWEAGSTTPVASAVGSGGGAITGKAGAITGGGNVSVNDNSKYYQDMLSKIDSTYSGIADSTTAAQRAALDAAVAQMEGNRTSINTGYDDLARQLYIDRRQAERKIPQQLAAQGYTGGLSESSNLGLQTAYQELLSQGERAKISELANLDTSIASMRANGELSIANQGAQISQNALNSYMQIMEAAASDKRWATELGISQQQAATNLAWAQQQWADQMAMNQQQFDWQKQQYGDSQSQTDYANQLKTAQSLAEYGDFSGYANLGYDPTTMQKNYQQIMNNSKKTSSSGGGGNNNNSNLGFVDGTVNNANNNADAGGNFGLSYLYNNSSSTAQFRAAAKQLGYDEAVISRFLTGY